MSFISGIVQAFLQLWSLKGFKSSQKNIQLNNLTVIFSGINLMLLLGATDIFAHFFFIVSSVCKNRKTLVLWVRNSPWRKHSHTFVSFYNARLIRGDLPYKPIESQAGYTQRGGVSPIETKRTSQQKVLATACIHRWRGRRRSQVRQLQWRHVSSGVEGQ